MAERSAARCELLPPLTGLREKVAVSSQGYGQRGRKDHFSAALPLPLVRRGLVAQGLTFFVVKKTKRRRA